MSCEFIAVMLVSSPMGLASRVRMVPGKGRTEADPSASLRDDKSKFGVRRKPVKVRWTAPRERMRSTISWPR